MNGTGFGGGLGILILSLLYFLPAFIAYLRGHHQKAAIGVLNIFLGWTVLGWIAALIWAVSAVRKVTQMANPSKE